MGVAVTHAERPNVSPLSCEPPAGVNGRLEEDHDSRALLVNCSGWLGPGRRDAEAGQPEHPTKDYRKSNPLADAGKPVVRLSVGENIYDETYADD